MVSTPEMMESVNALFCYIENISEQLGISVGTAHKIVHDDLAFLRSVVIGVPKC